MQSPISSATDVRSKLESRKSPTHSTLILLTLAAVVLLVSYVETMVLPAIPTIQKDLSASPTLASWITSVVLLVGAASSPIFGKLGDVYGKKRMFLVAVSFYTAGVGLAGFSPSIYFLLFARALQGAGFAAFPLALAMVTDIFPKEKLAAAQGAIAGAAAISATAGLVLGSYVVQDLGWRYAFYTALILSVAFFVLAVVILKESPIRSKAKVDYLGALLLTSGITLTLLYLTEGSSLGWLSYENITLLISGLALTITFFLLERKKTEPLIQLSLLRIRNVLVANLVSIISGMGNFLLFYAFIFYAELPAPAGLGLDIIPTGLALAPATLVMLVVGPISGKLVTKIGPKPVMLTGASVLIIGFLMFILNRSTSFDIIIDAAVSLAGIVALSVPVVNMISVSLPKDVVTVGQGINNMLKSLGQAAGPILATSIMTSFTQPLTKVVNGQTFVIGNVPTPMAFNFIYSIGIVLTFSIVFLSLTTKNYIFRETKSK